MKAITEEYYVWFNKIRNKVESGTIADFLRRKSKRNVDEEVKVICKLKCDENESQNIVNIINSSLR
ncbi:MAG: hypothetical protein NXI20_03800 [bacterium]|nr:hypothetical protein [bacterium]